jgi:omega-6 fatty acid desaturase (delta-12 desaturase)
VPDARAWTQILARYRAPSAARSIIELAITIVPLGLVWAFMWATLGIGYWLCLLLSAPAAGLLVRLFMIQHDCGHGAFFRHRLDFVRW